MRADEDRLFQRYRTSGEPAALAGVFDLVAPDLLRLALHVTRHTADAEDVLQQTFLTAIETAAQWDDQRRLFPWLVGILTNQARLRTRAQARVIDSGRLANRPADDPAIAAERAELDAALREAIDALGDTYRPILHLHLHHGLNCKEIAAALGRPAGTVRTQLVRGLQQLRRALPAGLGVLAATMTCGRGLAAVRRVVLTEAGAASGLPTVQAITLTGVATMKKMIVLPAAATVLLLGVLANPFAPAPHDDAVEGGPAFATGTATTVAGSDATTSPERAAADRASLREPSGVLTVHVRGPLAQRVSAYESIASSGEGAALPDVAVEVWPGPDDELPFDGSLRALRTGPDGSARFSLPAGVYRVRAGHRDGDRDPHVDRDARRVDVVAGSKTSLEVFLSMAGSLRGRVVDEDGRAVPHAEIWVGSDVLGVTPTPDQVLRRAALSDATGSFALTYADTEQRVGARKPGYAASTAVAAHALDDSPIELVLRRGAAAVRGTVVDPRGRPVADAVIGLQPVARGESPVPLAVLARSDAQGQFAIVDLAPGQYRCRANAPQRRHATTAFAVEAFAQAEVSLQLNDAIAVVGRLRDAAGASLARVPVWIELAGTVRSTATTLTSDRGRFVFKGVPAQPFTIEAGRWHSSSRVRRVIHTPTAPLMRLDLTLREAPGLRGSLEDPQGHPLVGWYVAALAADRHPLATTTTTGDGTFELRDLGAGRHRVVAWCNGGEASTPAVELTAVAGAGEVTLRAPMTALPRAALHGRVVDDRGRPLAGAQTFLQTPGDGMSIEGATTGPDGRFAFEQLSQGEHTLDVHAPGRAPHSLTVHLAHQQPTRLDDVRVHREAIVRLRFLHPDGTPWTERPPLPRLRNAAGTVYAEFTVEAGQVVARGLPAGPLEVHAPPGAPWSMEELYIDLRAGATIDLDVPLRAERR